MIQRDRRREILELVASGELTPEAAAELLADVETQPDTHVGAEESPADGDEPTAPGSSATSRGPGAAAEPQAAGTDTSRDSAPTEARGAARPAGAADDPDAIVTVRVRSNCRAVSIVGDPDVRTAVAEGEHIARVDGGTLTIESTLDRSPGFAFMRTPGLRARTMVRVGAQHVRPLTVRMNPDLALDSQMDAGSLTIRDVRGPIRAYTSAGALRIDGFESPIELRVAAGSATARGRLTHGTSRVECDAGKVTIRLSADSSVNVRGRVNLGQLNAPDRIGAGDGELEIVANLGAVDVGLEEDEGEDALFDGEVLD